MSRIKLLCLDIYGVCLLDQVLYGWPGLSKIF
jgi:hypothetical protein